MVLSWDDDTVQLLIEKPHRLLSIEPWKTWIIDHGGVEGIYQHLAALPLPEREQKILEVMFANPGATNQQYAAMLSMHRVTFQRALKQLYSMISVHLAAQATRSQLESKPAPVTLPTNPWMPVPMTPLIGRAREVASIDTWLQTPAIRLITLIGSGGIGKTRLAIQVGWDILPEFRDGVAFVSLTTISDPALVLTTIIRTLGITEEGDSPITLLQDYFAAKQFCLILDNFEHVLEAAPTISQLLRHAPHLKIITTSRVRLNVYGERLLKVPTLTLPNPDSTPTFEDYQNSEAIRLFVDRAQAVDADFQLGLDNAQAIHTICARLDGLALAIELAASRVDRYSLNTILSRLEQRLAFLTYGPQDVDPRHQTLLATIAWSHELLPPPIQKVFRCLSVLVDGWTFAAFQAVCFEQQISEIEGESILHTLLDHHLIIQLQRIDDGQHYGMLETIREYALQELQKSGEEIAVRLRHLQYYVQLTEPTEQILLGGQQLHWTNVLKRAYPNIRAALGWGLANGFETLTSILASHLPRFWEVAEASNEGLLWLPQCIALNHEDKLMARLLQGLSRSYIPSTSFDQALQFGHQALEVARRSDDSWRVANILGDLGVISSYKGNYDDSIDFYNQGLSIGRAIYHDGEIGRLTLNLGTIAFRRGRFEEADTHYREALEYMRKLEDLNGIGLILNNLGASAIYQGRLQEAEGLLKESLVIRKELGIVGGITTTLGNLAWLWVEQKRSVESRAGLLAFLEWVPKSEMQVQIGEAIELFVRILYFEGHPPHDVMEWYFIWKLIQQRYHGVIDPSAQPWHDMMIAYGVAELGQAAIDEALNNLPSLSYEQILEKLTKALQER